MMSQQDASFILFLMSIGFTVLGNFVVGYINAGRLLKHAQDEKLLGEMIDLVKASSAASKKRRKHSQNYGMVEVEKPMMLPRFNFWIILLMAVAAYSVLAALA